MRARQTRLLFTALAVLALAGCPEEKRAEAAATAAPPKRITILYLSDLAGYLEPCGCSANLRGGLPRTTAVVKKIRAENPDTFVVAGGDLLFENKPEGARRDQELRKAEAAAEMLKMLGLAATLQGERDLYAGPDFAKKTALPYTSGAKLGATGLVSFGALGKTPEATFRIAVAHQGGTKVALPLADEAKRSGAHVLFAAHRDNLLEDDVNRALLDAAIPVIQVQGRGQSLARLDVTLAGDASKGFAVLRGAAQRDEELDLIQLRKQEYGKKQAAAQAAGNAQLATALKGKLDELEGRAKTLRETPLPTPPVDRPSLTVSFIPILDTLPEDPDARAALERYKKDIAAINVAYATANAKPCPPPAKGQPFYIGMNEAPKGGAVSCKQCHASQFAFWEKTGHAHAYETLAKQNRQFDLDCIKCHVTGWMEPGGVCNLAKPGDRKDVQCESCHGPASAHALEPPKHIVRSTSEATCKTCHTPENSTGFEFTSFRKRILGPGHGQPTP